MKKRDQITLGDIYGQMLKSVKVVEEACGVCATDYIKKSKKNPKMPQNAFSDKNELQSGGPQEKGGFHKALNDPKDFDKQEDNEEYPRPRTKKEKNMDELKRQLKNPNLPDKKKKSLEMALQKIEDGLQAEEGEEGFFKESKKIARKRLNTFMAKKSTFDKLFESFMGGSFDEQEDAQEIDALGLKDAPTDDEFGDDEFGDDEFGDEVTVTLSRDLAQQLHDVLMGVLGGEEDMGEEGDDLDFDDEGGDFDSVDDEDEIDFSEDEERGVHPTDKVGNDGTVGPKNSKDGPHKLQGKSNKVSGKPQPRNQGTKVVGTTDKVGNDGDYGHALHGAKQPDMGKQNKVSDIRQAEDFFR
jgi:hypothetical protein